MSSLPGTLWIVATPLGNPGDLSPRARSILQSADGVLAEDTRRSARLFSRWGLGPRHFISFHEHNEEQQIASIISSLLQGKHIALISDAGTPLISDPGYRLVKTCRQHNLHVSPIPGPSAPIAALSASGLPPLPFTFLGFIPRRKSEIQNLFSPYATLPLTLIFFDRKDRIKQTLAIIFPILGERELCLARELSKIHEEFTHLFLSQHATLSQNFLGELTVLIGPPLQINRCSPEKVKRLITIMRDIGDKPKNIVQQVHEQVQGWNKKEIYQLMQREYHER